MILKILNRLMTIKLSIRYICEFIGFIRYTCNLRFYKYINVIMKIYKEIDEIHPKTIKFLLFFYHETISSTNPNHASKYVLNNCVLSFLPS